MAAGLAGMPDELALPFDRPRPAVPLVPRRRDHCRHPREPHAAARLARDYGVTVFMVLQAALAVLLSRLGAGTDIPIGAPVAGRTERRSTPGRVLRQHPGAAYRPVRRPDLRRLFARVRERDLAAYAHQDVPFERLVEELNPVRPPPTTPCSR